MAVKLIRGVPMQRALRCTTPMVGLPLIMRSDLPKFASNNRAQATAEEGKAVAQGMIAFYGTYTINEGVKTLTTRIEGSSYPNLIGGEQKRIITLLTRDELRYTNPATSTGTKAESVWRRAK